MNIIISVIGSISIDLVWCILEKWKSKWKYFKWINTIGKAGGKLFYLKRKKFKKKNDKSWRENETFLIELNQSASIVFTLDKKLCDFSSRFMELIELIIQAIFFFVNHFENVYLLIIVDCLNSKLFQVHWFCMHYFMKFFRSCFWEFGFSFINDKKICGIVLHLT